MTISSINIRRFEAEDLEACAEFEAFIHSEDMIVSVAPSAVSRSVADSPLEGYAWLRLERSFDGGVTRYFARIDSPGSRPGPADSTWMEEGLRMFTLPEGVSIVQAYMGDYGEDGNNDILLLLSDGAWMLIEPQEEGAVSPIEATPPTERSTPREEFEPYDPEPAERGDHDNIQEPQRSGAGAPATPAPGSGTRENSRQTGHDYLDGI